MVSGPFPCDRPRLEIVGPFYKGRNKRSEYLHKGTDLQLAELELEIRDSRFLKIPGMCQRRGV